MKKGKAKISAGLLMFKRSQGCLKFLLAHPGGPFFQQKDEGWWTIPKGLPEMGEELLQTAIREFREETGIISAPPYLPLGEVKQKGGKTVHAWAFEGEWEESSGIQCNSFRMEWPLKSGKYQSFPEVDQAAWMDSKTALRKINEAQQAFIRKLSETLG